MHDTHSLTHTHIHAHTHTHTRTHACAIAEKSYSKQTSFSETAASANTGVATYVRCRLSQTLDQKRIIENVPKHEHRIAKDVYIANLCSHPPRLGPAKQIAGRTNEKMDSGTAKITE